ncbi:hypothetical protein IGB42_02132 [Andreprevotia sp. IGB-42]|uniref:hypothetical protein n=1 Tax=Andreprevotia sp. IGB-42 TaxID=2497473 RepID=UPI00135A38D2|nr:hypothetical protein [Andreprevotia sp. IGB-42]KAF0813204.1 hypothetical protein IGB42_02132 [Andreprevotia sp. IGB-42]
MTPPAIVVVAPAELVPALQHSLARFHDWPLVWESATTIQPADIDDALYLWINPGLDDFFARDAQGLQGVDLMLAGEPALASQLGWIIAAGGTLSNLNTLAPLIDALSPSAPWAWLHAGGPGAGAFAATLYQRWQRQQQAVLEWLASDGQLPQMPQAMQHFNPASWLALAQTQLMGIQADAQSYADWADAREFTSYHASKPDWPAVFPGLATLTSHAEPALQLARLLLALPLLPNAGQTDPL